MHMQKFLGKLASMSLVAMFLMPCSLVFAEEDRPSLYTPFSIEVGGTGATTLEGAKEILEIPKVVQTAGDDENLVMSQKAVTDAIAAGSGGGIVVTQSAGSSATSVMSQNATTNAIDDAKTPIVQTTGQDENVVMSQKAVTDSLISMAQNTIVQSSGQSTTEVMSQKAVTDTFDAVIPKTAIVHTTGQSTTAVMSQKATTDAILTVDNVNTLIQTALANQMSNIYPVGSIHMSINSTDPGTLFGGNWERWGNGRTIVGVDENDPQGYFPTAEWLGGSRNHSHNYRIKVPHWYGAIIPGTSETGCYNALTSQYTGWTGDSGVTCSVNNNLTNATTSKSASTHYSQGTTNSINNWSPCITCYMWKRVA